MYGGKDEVIAQSPSRPFKVPDALSLYLCTLNASFISFGFMLQPTHGGSLDTQGSCWIVDPHNPA